MMGVVSSKKSRGREKLKMIDLTLVSSNELHDLTKKHKKLTKAHRPRLCM